MWWVTKVMPLLLWIGFILGAASQPSDFFLPAEKEIVLGLPREVLQYPYHLTVSLVLGVLFWRCLATGGSEKARSSPGFFSLFGSALVSVASELIQSGIPTRSFAVQDLALDCSGAMLGIAIVGHLLRGRPKQTRG